MNERSPTWQRVTDQITWYDSAAKKAQQRYRLLRLSEIVVAASIPVTAALGGSTGLAAVLGAVIVVLAGVQELYGFQKNWTTYRATCETLRREKHLYEAKAGQYAGEDRDALFALAIEGHMSEEVGKWSESQAAPAAAQ